MLLVYRPDILRALRLKGIANVDLGAYSTKVNIRNVRKMRLDICGILIYSTVSYNVSHTHDINSLLRMLNGFLL